VELIKLQLSGNEIQRDYTTNWKFLD